jgi:hypothetical protein
MNYGIRTGVVGGGTGLVAALTLLLAEENLEILRVTSGPVCVTVSLGANPPLSCYTPACVI